MCVVVYLLPEAVFTPCFSMFSNISVCPDCIKTFEDALVMQQKNPFMANVMTVLHTSGSPFSASVGG